MQRMWIKTWNNFFECELARCYKICLRKKTQKNIYNWNW